MSDISKTALKILEALVQVDNNSKNVFNSLDNNYVVSCTNLYVWFEKSKNMLLNLKIKSSLLAEFSSLTTGGKHCEVECSEFKAYIHHFKLCLREIIEHYGHNETESPRVEKPKKDTTITTQYPEIITLKWLYSYVPWYFWLISLFLLYIAFDLGAYISQEYDISLLKKILSYLMSFVLK